MPVHLPAAPKTATIPIEQIEIDPQNVRTVYPAETVEQLRRALQSGLENNEQYINPPTVYPVGADRFRVKHGNCRVLAAHGVVDQLEVRIVDPPSRPVDKMLDQLGENLLQGGLDPIDTAQALRNLRTNEELSISGIVDVLAARGIKRSKFWVNMHLGLLRLHPFAVEAVRSGQIAPRTAWLVRGLSEQEQVRWTREIIAQGLSQRAVEERLGIHQHDDDGDGADIDTSNPEVAYLQLGERIEEAANREEDLPRRPRRELDGERRSGSVERRWELVAARVPESALRDRKLQKLEQHEWIKRASTQERDLAREFVFFGGCEPESAVALVQQASQEASAAPGLVAAANHLAQVGEQPVPVQADSALVRLLNLRLARVAGSQAAAEQVSAG
jgi:hypothetical protein